MECTFPKFRDLPAELRRDIWKQALPSRIVAINYQKNDFNANPIQQTLPVLLRVCRESRETALHLYKSGPPAFDAGNEVRIRSGSNGAAGSSRESQHLVEASAFVRIDIQTQSALRRRGPPGSGPLYELRTHKSNLYPVWLDMSSDILLFKRGTFWPPGFKFQLLGSMTRRPSNSLQHIAFDVDWLPFFAGWNNPSHCRRFLLDLILQQMFPRWRTHWNSSNPVPTAGYLHYLQIDEFDSVQCITVLLRQRLEVIKIRLDDATLLKPGEWSFSLDTECRDFERHMGEEWSGVVWDVRLGRDNDQCLWKTACKFTPDLNIWLAHKTQICKQAHVDGGWIEPNKYSFTSSTTPGIAPLPPPPPPPVAWSPFWLRHAGPAARPLPRPLGNTTHSLRPLLPPPPGLTLPPLLPSSRSVMLPTQAGNIFTSPHPLPLPLPQSPPITRPLHRLHRTLPPPVPAPSVIWPSASPHTPPPPPPLSCNLLLTEEYPPPELLEGGDGQTYRGQ